MAVKDKKATSVVTAVLGGMKEASRQFDLDLKFIGSNDQQPRGNGVCPALLEQGYGAFKVVTHDAKKKLIPEDKRLPTIMSMLLSDDLEKREFVLDLLEKQEPEVWDLAAKVREFGQMQNIGVNAILGPDEKPTAYWNVIFGARRTIGRAINAAKHGEEATVRCVVVDWITDPQKLMHLAMIENIARKNATPIDEAKHYDSLKKLGMSLQKVAELTGEDYQTVRNRTQLLKLPQPVQDKIHEGKLSWTRALKAHTGQEGDGKTKPVTGDNTEGGRRRMPTIKQVEPIYLAVEKPDDVEQVAWDLTTEQVRKWIAHHAGFDYLTRDEIKKAKALEAKKQLETANAAAAAAKAAAESA